MTSECSTAYHVRKSHQSPARVPAGITSIEQDRLEPHPAARQGASRARNCAATGVFSFDGSTAVFFLERQKENGGGKPAGLPRHLRSVDRPARRGAPRVWLPPAKFRNGIWGVSHGHPALRGARGRHAGVVVPYGRQLPLHKGAFGTGCCGSPQPSPNSRRNSASSSASLSSRAWVPARDSMWWVSSWARVSRSSRRQSSSVQSSCSARAAKEP